MPTSLNATVAGGTGQIAAAPGGPPTGSSRSRAVAYAGAGTFGSAPASNNLVGQEQTPTFPYYGGGVSITVPGQAGISASANVEVQSHDVFNSSGVRIETWKEYRLVLTLHGVTTKTINGAWTGHFTTFPAPVYGFDPVLGMPTESGDKTPYLGNYISLNGRFSYQIVHQHFEVLTDTNLKEQFYRTAFGMDGGASMTFMIQHSRLVGIPNPHPPPTTVGIYVWMGETFTVSASGSITEPPQTIASAVDATYGHQFIVSGIHPNFTLNASGSPSDGSLRNARDGFVTRKGNAQIAGGPHSIAATMGGTVLELNLPDDEYITINNIIGSSTLDVPRGTVTGEPSWAAELALNAFNYKDNSNVPMQAFWRITGQYTDLTSHSHTFGPIDITGASPDSLKNPSSGLIQRTITEITDGSAERYRRGFPGFPDTPLESYNGISNPSNQPISGAISEPYGLFTPDIIGSVGSGGNSGFTSIAHTLQIRDTWANSTGNFLDSQHRPSRNLKPLLGTEWEAGRIQFAATHRFRCFEKPLLWENLGFCAVTYVGTEMVFTVNNPTGGKARTKLGTYNFAPYAYRYLRLRIKASVANVTLRLCVGTNGALHPDWPAFAWNMRLGAADTYQTVVIDLTRPDLIADPTTTAWTAALRSYHGDEVFIEFNSVQFRDAPKGQPVWMHFDKPAVYTVDYLEGFVETTGFRSPRILFQPQDGQGTQGLHGNKLDGYDAVTAFSTVGTWEHLRLVVNGDRTLTFGAPSEIGSPPTPQSFTDLWNSIKSTLNDFVGAPNGVPADVDTGIIVTVGTDLRQARRWIFNSQLQESREGHGYGKILGDAGVEIRKAHPTGPFPHGYYGMGSAWNNGPYGATLKFRTEWIFGGEVTGMFHDWDPSADPIELRDNDTQAVLASDTPDDDNFFRLYGKYGVVKPHNNTNGAAEYTEHLVPLGGGTPYSITYTPAGKLLNSYWLHGQFRDMDPQGYLTRFDWGPTSQFNKRWDAPILDRYQTWLDGSGFIGERVCILRDYTRQLMIFLCKSDQLIVTLYNIWHTDDPQVFVVDPNPGCRWPSYARNGSVLEGTHLRGAALYLGRSTDHGRTWRLTTVPGNYSAQSSVMHKERRVLAGWRGGVWYVRVGNPKWIPDPPANPNLPVSDSNPAGPLKGSYEWSEEHVINTSANPLASGHLIVRDDGTIEFGYLAASGVVEVVRNGALALDGTGAWR